MQKIELFVILLFIGIQSVFAQTKTISGTVTDNNGLPLTGVTVVISGTTTGTLTGLDGTFSLQAKPDDVLKISFIGYITREITVDRQTTYDIVLMEDVVSLEDVIVVGYGIQKKQSVVGSISTAKGSDLVKTGGLTNISSALTGLVPGLVTMNTVGKPGQDEADILIRGKSTWNNAAPLILVDGIERDMNDLDVNEVENVSVLKDASSTAVFGVRGANGVILITTKRGKTGEAVFKFGTNASVKMISKMPTFANSYESRWMRNEAIEIQTPANETSWSYYTPYEILMHYKNQDLPYLFPDVNWQKELLRDYTWSSKYNLEVSGGTDFVKYFAAVSYLHDGDIMKIQDFGQGYLPENDFNRLNFRTNLDFQPTKTTTFSVDIDGSQGKNNTMTIEDSKVWDGLWGKSPDWYPVRYEDGTFAWTITDDRQYNPVYAVNFSGMTSTTTTDINTIFRLDQKLDMITKGLSFKALGSFQSVYVTDGPTISGNPRELKYIDPFTGNVEINYPIDYTRYTHGFNYIPLVSRTTPVSVSGAGSRNLMYQGSLNYDRSIGRHKIGGLLNFKRQENSFENEFTSYREEWAGRLTYEYDNRYLLETNIGYNGSEQFGPGYKFGFFPSFAMGWNLGNEKFFTQKFEFINKLKFRFSRGTVGNDNAGGTRWLYLSSWAYLNERYRFGKDNPSPSPYVIADEINIGNPSIRWETATKNDLAVETGFFENLITVNFDYFWGHRKDIFMSAEQRKISPWFGASPVAANIGETKDNGWEFEAGFNKMTGSGFRYFANISMSYSKDEIIYMEDPELTPDYKKNAGFPIGQQKATLYSDIINSWDEIYTGVMSLNNPLGLPGDFRFVDYNADGYIDDKDEVPYGFSNHPQVVNNYTFGADYKGFNLMFQFYSTRNSTLTQSLGIWGNWGGTFMNETIDRIVLDNGWIPGRESTATYRRPDFNFPNVGDGQFNKVDGTLWRLKTAEIAYTFSGKYLSRFGVSNARLFVNGNNLWLWSHMNEDRERGSKRQNSDFGGFDKYPLTKRVNLGVNITF